MNRPAAIAILLLSIRVGAQPDAAKEAALRHAVETSRDTLKVQALNALGNYYYGIRFDSARTCYEKARRLSHELHYDKGYYDYTSNIGNVLTYEGKFSQLERLMAAGVAYARKTHNIHYEAVLTANLGNACMYQSKFEQAIAHFQRSLSLFEKNGEPKFIKHLQMFTSLCFYNASEFDKSLAYAEKALARARSENAEKLQCSALSTIGKCHIEKDEFSKALPFTMQALDIAKKQGMSVEVADTKFDLSRIYAGLGQYEKAKKLVSEASKFYGQTGNLFNRINAQAYLARYESMTGNAADAITLIERTRDTAVANKMGQHLTLITEFAAGIYEKAGRYKDAYQAEVRLAELNDSLNSVESRNKLQEADERYQASEKQQTILKLEAIRNRNRYYLYGLTALVAFLLLTGMLSYRNLSARRKIAEQKVRELQQEKKIVAAKNMLEGEKTERTRLARDLHDGLGGMLSGVKFQLNSVRGNVILTEENAQLFSRTIGQLDQAIAEMRRVAHNMMPESLLKFGLDDALSDYCNSVSGATGIAIGYQSLGMAQRLEQGTEIVLYRIVQELLNNVVKHAAATTAQVQLSRNGGTVSLTVEDNGKGFDTSAESSGIGLENLRSRVDYLNGKLDIVSDGKGTSAHIEFEV